MEVKIDGSWKEVLSSEFNKEYFKSLTDFVKNEYSTKTVFPPGKNIFEAFNLCSFSNTKIVILGQDPYHTPGVANGLAFSSNSGQRIPPSLLNIFKELKSDLGKEIPDSPDLTAWAKEGVLLLNATLTVEKGKAGSHQGRGWEEFTDNVIKMISAKKDNIVFILWGAYAQAKESLVDTSKHFIIKSAHPSPFSAQRGFFGSRPFSRANKYLEEHGIIPVKW